MTGPLTCRGLGASPGIGAGPGFFLAARGRPAIAIPEGPFVLVTDDHAFAEIPWIRACRALVLLGAGSTTEGAIIARSLAVPCVVGLPQLRLHQGALVHEGGARFDAGVAIAVDGARSLVTLGASGAPGETPGIGERPVGA